MIKLLLDIIIWFVQLVYLVLIAAFTTIAQLFSIRPSATQKNLNGNVERGKTFVRAYYYLEAFENHGDPPETANTVASSLFEAWSDSDADNRIIIRATEYAKLHHGGNQLPTIEEARAKGFTG
nr:hypothetical protein [uncultured Roseovarius sp.]